MNNIVVSNTAPAATIAQIEDILNYFIESQDVKSNSKDLYKRTLRIYLDWVNNKGYGINNIARPQIIQYKEELLAAGLSSLTVGSYITSVRKFYTWAEANKFYQNVAKDIKSPKRKQQFKKQPLTALQSGLLIDYFKTQNLRDFAITNLLIRTGIRCIEAVRANIEDITYIGGKRVLKVWGKGRDEKDNFVVLTDKAYKPIEAYLATRERPNASEPLFISYSNNSKGDRLTTRTISYIAKQGLKAIGLNSRDFTAHSLRHTTAVNILRAGGRIEDAQGVLRHSNPATTQIYTATIATEQRIKNAPEELIDNIF